MALGLDSLRVVTFLRVGQQPGNISTPTAFRLIAQGCAATLGKVTPNPNYAEGVAPILGADNVSRIARGTIAAFHFLVMAEHLWRSICICELRFPG